MAKLKVLVVEPNDLVRDSLRSILDLEGTFQVIGDAREFAPLEEQIGDAGADVIILDHDSPASHEILRRVRAVRGDVGFLFLSTFLDEDDGPVPIDDDGARLLSKSASPLQLFAAVRNVAAAAHPRGVGSMDQTAADGRVDSGSGPTFLSSMSLSGSPQSVAWSAQADRPGPSLTRIEPPPDARERPDDLAAGRARERASWPRRALTLGLHLVSLALLSSVFAPLARWYYASQTPLGFDFWQYVYYVNYLRENFGLFTSMWKYVWHSGEPFARDYIMGHMYATLPLAHSFGVTLGSKIYLLVALFAFAVACYCLFFAISRNYLLSLALASVNLWSPNTVNALIRDGWASFSASQVFLPLSFLFLVNYFQRQNRKYAVAAAAISGLAFAGHGVAGLLTTAFSFTLIFLGFVFWPRERRPGEWTILPLYALIAAGVGLVFAFPLATSTVALRAVRPQGIKGDVFESALSGLVTGTNPLMFLLLAFALILVAPAVIRAIRGTSGEFRATVLRTSPFVGVTLLLIAVETSYLLGRSPLQAAGGPNRTWWIGGILLGCLVSAIATWAQNGQTDEHSRRRFWRSRGFQLKVWASMIYFLVIASASAVSFDAIKSMSLGAGAPTPTIFEALLKLGIENPKPEMLAKDLPTGVDLRSIQHRMWTGNPMLALVWNAVFPMPTVKGYFTQALRPSWDFWQESSINGQLFAAEKVPLDLARNNALFHLDWYAVRYLQPPIAPYLGDELVQRNKEIGLSFLEVKNPSKIVEPTNAAAILVVGDAIAYDVVVRTFASQNLNSQQFITIRGPLYVDQLSVDQLADFDGVILYNYRYDNRKKALDLLRDYLDRGGSLLVETGSEVQDSAADGLGDPFPVANLQKGAVEGEWMFKTSPHPVTQNVDFSAFAPPVYNGDPWKISAPSSERQVKPWAQAIVKDRDLPIVAAGKLGQGRVVWSGMNLPYHTLSNQNAAEAAFFASIVKWVFAVDQAAPDNYSVSRPRPEQVVVSGADFRGVVLRETAFDGWSARIVGEQDRSLRIHRAGPDFMYVRVPTGWSGPIEVRLAFGGAQADWFTLGLSVIVLLLVLDYLFFRRLLSIGGLRLLKLAARKTIGRLF